MIIEIFNIFSSKKFLAEVWSQINVMREEFDYIAIDGEETVSIYAKREELLKEFKKLQNDIKLSSQKIPNVQADYIEQSI